MEPTIDELATEKARQMMLENYDLQQKMLAVAHAMKEIPELPSEAPKDVSNILRAEFLSEGGVHTYIENQHFPYKGFPIAETVEKIDLLKKVSRATLSSFFHSLKGRSVWQKATLLLSAWFLADTAKATLYAFYRILMRVRIKPSMYSTAIRELHRVMSLEFDTDTAEEREIRKQMRDVVCMILEFDNAYRYRFQDVIVELDKVALKKNPGKEMQRLLSIMQEREVGQDIKDTWTLLKRFLPVALFFAPRMKHKFVTILTELNLETVKLSIEDKHYVAPRTDFVAGFMKNPVLPEDHLAIGRARIRKTELEAVDKVREESTAEHEKLRATYLSLGEGKPPEQQEVLQRKFNEANRVLDEKYNGMLNDLKPTYDELRKQLEAQYVSR